MFLFFTASLLAALIIIAFITKTHLGPLSADWFEKLGFAPRDLTPKEISRLFISAFVTDGHRAFWQALTMISLMVGGIEILFGTKLAFVAFWSIHLLTILLISFLIAMPLHWKQHPTGRLLVYTRDVGPSAGYFGCAGLLTARAPILNSSHRTFLFISVLAFLFIIFIKTLSKKSLRGPEINSDLAHLISYCLGCSFSLLLP